MTGTLISLISIFIGIISANVFAYFKNKYSFGFTGNTLIGVFGSILFIKTFGRLGFDPWAIMGDGIFHSSLFVVNCLVSIFGSIIGLIVIKSITIKVS
ncbi:hypothetical protein HNV10_05190 [Winogradskyella litoriviva]|uniref:Fluoride ion transporter CrcB n=1 Tax=Winogradskyella litoriviva TaxID=1220182 RepID=A0ABX2E4A7_9FLAO|nr:hypothetical protein [Winogradskyella litoriviva]NRD22624.1 hypothetical protein [Winogradskyella litoriviva]